MGADHLERDGLWVVLGLFVGLIAIVVAGGVVYAVIKSSLFLLMNAFA